MIISEALAQRIVDTAACLVHTNVNIMNPEGVIIGTAQPGRRGTFHKGARDVAENGAAVEIYPDEVGLYPGSREGVNLPIVMDGQIVGVIGVTGEPDGVRGIARLTKMITELILERELLHQETQSRQRLAEHFVDLLLWSGPAPSRGRVLRAAKALGLDPDLPRAVAVAGVSGLLSAFQNRYGASELVIERASEAILSGLSEARALAGQDVAVVLDERLVVLKALPIGDPAWEAREWGKLASACLGSMPGLDVRVEVRVGIGALAQSLEEYPPSFRQALYCLEAGGPGPGASSIHDPELAVGFLLAEMGAGPGGMVLRPLAGRLARCLERRPELAGTVRALFAHRFELETTAFALGIHRNTLAYRLGRLKEQTGLDPVRRHDDAVLLRAALSIAMFPGPA